MGIKFVDKFLFGMNAKKTSKKEKYIWYFSIIVLLSILLFFIEPLLFFIMSNYVIISMLCVIIYIIYGIKSQNWINGIQQNLIIVVVVVAFLGIKFKDSPKFIKLKKNAEYHCKQIGSDLWINLKVKEDTYEIQVARPVDGKWGEWKKGKTSEITKQRFTDSGNEYYCFYLEDYPFVGLRAMVAFDDAFSSCDIKFNNELYILNDGNANDPWNK